MAIKLLFQGGPFHGSQQQPGLPTVDGTVLEVLQARQYVTSREACHFQTCGRTDAGVSARGYVIAFNVTKPLVLSELNAFLPPNIVAWARAAVPADFSPRRAARTRHYKYFVDLAAARFRVEEEDSGETRSQPREDAQSIDLARVAWGCRCLEGTHDFTNFTKPEKFKKDPGVSPVRTLSAARVSPVPELDSLEFEFVGQSFLWNQVRLMVAALIQLGTGEITRAGFEAFFDPSTRPRLVRAPAAPLILWDVEYGPEVYFHVPRRARKQLRRRLGPQLTRARLFVNQFGGLDLA